MNRSSDNHLLPLLGAALDQTRSSACITTAELDWPGPQIVYVNPAYCKMTGRTMEDVIGQTPRIMHGPLTSRSVLDRLRSDLESGRPFVGETVNYRKDGTPFLISWRIDPVVDATGRTTNYIATQDDVTQLRRAERLLAAEQIVDRSVPGLLNQLDSTADKNFASLSADLRGAVAGLIGYGMISVDGVVKLGSAQVEFSACDNHDHDDSVVAATVDGRGRAVTGSFGDSKWIGCSVTNERSGIEGVILVTGLSQPELDFVDQHGFERVAECARRVLGSLAEYERQRMVAVELQQNLLPVETPVIDGLKLSARYEPGVFASNIGGDWYDVIEDDRRLILVVGDLAGSGIRAAADMGRVRLLTKTLLQQGVPVADVFAVLNQFCSEEDLVGTALAVTVDMENMSMNAVSAGHLPPVIRHPASTELVTLQPGPLLGIGGNPSYPSHQINMSEGDALLMFTDGLIERPEETIDESLAKLVDMVSTLPPDAGVMCERLVNTRLADNPEDDIAVLSAQLTSPGRFPRSDEATD